MRSAALSFVGSPSLQTIDLLVANRVLAADGAAEFGVLSTIGGAAFFATATIPLVLMPAAARGRPAPPRHGGGADGGRRPRHRRRRRSSLARPLRAPTPSARSTRDVARLVGPYLLAMALLGLIRVQVARRAADRRAAACAGPSPSPRRCVAEALVAVALVGPSVDAVVATTLFTTAGLAVVLELPARRALAPTPCVASSDGRRDATLGRWSACAPSPPRVRVATSRGLWVDEAISVSQAQLPFGEMLADCTTTDVHPPLHHALLWVTVRLFGTSEFAVRLPSLIAGVALVPAMCWVGSVLYDRRTGWVAAMLAAIAPFCVWYSQEARMYSHVHAARHAGRRRPGAGHPPRPHGVDWVAVRRRRRLLLWTQYFAILPVLVQQVGVRRGCSGGTATTRERRRSLVLGLARRRAPSCS